MNGQHPLWTAVALGSHTLKSRLVLPPMASGTGDAEGLVTDRTLEHYGRLVGERVAIAFVEYTYVHDTGRSEPNQLGLSRPEHRAGLARLAGLIRAQGAMPGIQLTHAGGKTDESLIGRQPLGASAVAIPAHGGDMPAPAPMTADEVSTLFAAFVQAAVWAEDAGFQVIEIHAAHGYFFNQWLSPITNRRGDRHGGSREARSALLIDLVRELRRVLSPKTLLSIRFPAQDRLDGGLTLEDGVWLAQRITAAGVDVLNVSSGLGGWRRGRDQRGEGYLVADARELRRRVGIPVIGVGGIQSLAYCAEVLNSQEVDLLAVGRALLANPAWPCAA
jgi:NADPH2 dehydrogenase